MRRGCVWPIKPATPRPNSRQILGNCVVLPLPVSPHKITTWLSIIAAAISSRRAETGSSSAYSGFGKLAKRAAYLAWEIRTFCAISPNKRCNFSFAFSSSNCCSDFCKSATSRNLRRSVCLSANMQVCRAVSRLIVAFKLAGLFVCMSCNFNMLIALQL